MAEQRRKTPERKHKTEGLRPQAVGERTYRQAAVYTTVTSVSQSPVTAYLPLPAGIK